MDHAQGRRRALATREVAGELGVHPRTVRRWIQGGHLEAAQPGGPAGQYRVPADAVARVWDEIKRR